eukprot:165432-Alexandrium_andersonii.AAC.1
MWLSSARWRFALHGSMSLLRRTYMQAARKHREFHCSSGLPWSPPGRIFGVFVAARRYS